MVVHKPHLNTPEKRWVKARKIEAMIGMDLAGKDLLDLGAGSGHLSNYFLERGARVSAADTDGYRYASKAPFYLIESDILPFDDASFDIVISNHVLEHVGDRKAQAMALSEIHRILRPGGMLYLGVPNKFEPIEPHYKLPFLGSLPKSLADFLVKKFRGGIEYDCYPVSRGELSRMVLQVFPSFEDKTAEAYHWFVEHELSGWRRGAFKLIPPPMPVIPSFIFLARR